MSRVHWIDCTTADVAMRAGHRLAQVASYPWFDRERWAVGFGLVGRGGLYQVETVGKYSSPSIAYWILEGVPEARVVVCEDDGTLQVSGGPGAFLAGFNYLIPREEGVFDLDVAADLLNGAAVARLGVSRALCLREGISLEPSYVPKGVTGSGYVYRRRIAREDFLQDLSATLDSVDPLARLLEALMLAAERDGSGKASFDFGSRSEQYGCVFTGALHVELLRKRGWLGGNAWIGVGGDKNSMRNLRSLGPYNWGLWEVADTEQPLSDELWPFR